MDILQQFSLKKGLAQLADNEEVLPLCVPPLDLLKAGFSNFILLPKGVCTVNVVMACISGHSNSLLDFSGVRFPGAQAYNKYLGSMEASLVVIRTMLDEQINIHLLPFLKIYILA